MSSIYGLCHCVEMCYACVKELIIPCVCMYVCLYGCMYVCVCVCVCVCARVRAYVRACVYVINVLRWESY